MPYPTLVPAPAATYDALYAHFGDPRQAGFENTHIVTATHQIANGKVVHVRCHKLIIAKLQAVWDDLHNSGHLGLIQSYDGCFVIRSIRGSTHPSLHSWGLAIDLNADRFPLGSLKKQDPRLTSAFAKQGFFAGENFCHRHDPMHFEYTTGAI